LTRRTLAELALGTPTRRVHPAAGSGAALAWGEVDIAFGPFDNLIAGVRLPLMVRERYACIVRTNHPKFPGGMTLEAFKCGDQRWPMRLAWIMPQSTGF
jgi:hypothetical protein